MEDAIKALRGLVILQVILVALICIFFIFPGHGEFTAIVIFTLFVLMSVAAGEQTEQRIRAIQ